MDLLIKIHNYVDDDIREVVKFIKEKNKSNSDQKKIKAKSIEDNLYKRYDNANINAKHEYLNCNKNDNYYAKSNVNHIQVSNKTNTTSNNNNHDPYEEYINYDKFHQVIELRKFSKEKKLIKHNSYSNSLNMNSIKIKDQASNIKNTNNTNSIQCLYNQRYNKNNVISDINEKLLNNNRINTDHYSCSFNSEYNNKTNKELNNSIYRNCKTHNTVASSISQQDSNIDDNNIVKSFINKMKSSYLCKTNNDIQSKPNINYFDSIISVNTVNTNYSLDTNTNVTNVNVYTDSNSSSKLKNTSNIIISDDLIKNIQSINNNSRLNQKDRTNKSTTRIEHKNIIETIDYSTIKNNIASSNYSSNKSQIEEKIKKSLDNLSAKNNNIIRISNDKSNISNNKNTSIDNYKDIKDKEDSKNNNDINSSHRKLLKNNTENNIKHTNNIKQISIDVKEASRTINNKETGIKENKKNIKLKINENLINNVDNNNQYDNKENRELISSKYKRLINNSISTRNLFSYNSLNNYHHILENKLDKVNEVNKNNVINIKNELKIEKNVVNIEINSKCFKNNSKVTICNDDGLNDVNNKSKTNLISIITIKDCRKESHIKNKHMKEDGSKNNCKNSLMNNGVLDCVKNKTSNSDIKSNILNNILKKRELEKQVKMKEEINRDAYKIINKENKDVKLLSNNKTDLNEIDVTNYSKNKNNDLNTDDTSKQISDSNKNYLTEMKRQYGIKYQQKGINGQIYLLPDKIKRKEIKNPENKEYQESYKEEVELEAKAQEKEVDKSKTSNKDYNKNSIEQNPKPSHKNIILLNKHSKVHSLNLYSSHKLQSTLALKHNTYDKISYNTNVNSVCDYNNKSNILTDSTTLRSTNALNNNSKANSSLCKSIFKHSETAQSLNFYNTLSTKSIKKNKDSGYKLSNKFNDYFCLKCSNINLSSNPKINENFDKKHSNYNDY